MCKVCIFELEVNNKQARPQMIIKTYIGKDKEFLIDTNELEFDKNGKLANVGETKLPKSVKNDADKLEFFTKCYDLVEINGHYYDRTMIAAVVRGFRVTV